MKKGLFNIFGFLLLCLAPILLQAQTTIRANKAEIKNEIKLAGKAVKGVSNATTIGTGSADSLITQKAVKDYVTSAVATGDVTLRASKPSPITTYTTKVVIDTVGTDTMYVWNASRYMRFEAGSGGGGSPTGSAGGYVTDTIQILTYDADTVEWDLTAGVDATLDLAGDTYLKIINPDTPSYVTCYVTHTLAGSELTLPGRLPTGFSWALGTNDVTGLGGRYDGTTWWWTREIYEAPFAYEAESTTFFAANTGLTTPQKDAVNDLVIALKAIGWSKFQAIYPMVGGTASAHKWNLKDPRDLDAAFRLQFFGTWAHDASGSDPDGTTAYANTFFHPLERNVGITPADLANINSFHFSYYTPENTAPGASSDRVLFGYVGGADNIVWDNYNTSNKFIQHGDAITTTLISQTVFNGLSTISRTSQTSSKAFFGASQVGSTVTTSRNQAASTTPIFLGAQNNAGTARWFGNYKCQFFSCGPSLSDAEVAALNTAVSNFQTALSR